MRNLLLSIAFATTLTAAAHAIPMPTSYTYDFSGGTSNVDLTGTITIDSSGKVTGGSIKGGGISYYSLTTIPTDLPKGYSNFSLTDTMSGYVDIAYALFTPGDKSFSIDTKDSSLDHLGRTYDFTSGKFTLETPVTTAATPEPSSLILLGTGALGLAGAVRRRFFPRA